MINLKYIDNEHTVANVSRYDTTCSITQFSTCINPIWN